MRDKVWFNLLSQVLHLLSSLKSAGSKTSQYLVWPPFASSSATHLLHLELIGLLIVACGMLVHSSSMAVRSCWILVKVVDEWHNNGPQDLVTVSLCIQNAQQLLFQATTENPSLSTLLDYIKKKKKKKNLSLFQNLHLSLYLSLLPLLVCIYLNNAWDLVLLELPLYVCLFKINRFMYSQL